MAQTAEGRRNADRIKSIARNRHMNVQEALKRFALERLLYRLSANDDAHRWLLKGGALFWLDDDGERSEEHTSELQSLMRRSYAVFCLKKKTHVKETIYKRH